MVNLIENTLRDGSYVVDFQITAAQTALISAALSGLGIELIEVGHGLGLGAWNRHDCGLAAENDTDYIRAAVSAAPTAKIGVFLIPGIGNIEDIDRACDAGIKFLRIGSNVDTYEKIAPLAEYAASKDLLVTANLMKSYGVKSYEFTQIAKDIAKWKTVQVIYLVDSAGCMLPTEVYEYLNRTKEQVDLHLGFHGHNNLSMAVANSLEAIRAGASYIDSSILGLGRSAGNAQTEILVHFLDKTGILPLRRPIYEFYDLANRYVLPLAENHRGLQDDEIHIGISRFHTSFMPLAVKTAEELGIEKRKLIKMVSDINCINPDENLFRQIGEKIRKDG